MVPVAAGGTLNDYVPFYFAARSPMLYTIYKGNVEGCKDGQNPILHLTSSVEGSNKPVFHSLLPTVTPRWQSAIFFADTDRLDKVDWDIMKATYWVDTVEDNDRSRCRLAEFLVHAFFPWELVSGIGVINNAIADEVTEAIAPKAHQPEVKVQRNWYY